MSVPRYPPPTSRASRPVSNSNSRYGGAWPAGSVLALIAGLSLGCPSSEADPKVESSTTNEAETSSAGESETSSGLESETEGSTGTEGSTETGELEVSVNWIEVAAADYKLELVPEFDTALTSYEAIADGPGIAVYIDVIVDADVDEVRFNGEGSSLVGFRTWRSEVELISPTSATIEVVAAGAELPIYSVEIVAP